MAGREDAAEESRFAMRCTGTFAVLEFCWVPGVAAVPGLSEPPVLGPSVGAGADAGAGAGADDPGRALPALPVPARVPGRGALLGPAGLFALARVPVPVPGALSGRAVPLVPVVLLVLAGEPLLGVPLELAVLPPEPSTLPVEPPSDP
ncbi:hypothetical protein [Streptomyces sp. NPDC051561]|uniref:hypothetical protein n=1 Tax=Streptomyces sp. NPDC051561 TaxID=3365658 RepID=UPI003790AFC0